MLKYMNGCTRNRLNFLVQTLIACKDTVDFVDCLQESAEAHEFDRLQRILKDCRAVT